MVRIRLILESAAVLAFGWFAVHGPLAAMVISGTIAGALLAKDAIANPALMKTGWPIIAGGMFGITVCWGTGFLLVSIIGSSETVYVGPGLDRWNLPGTILGAAIWISATIWGVRREKARRKKPATQL